MRSIHVIYGFSLCAFIFLPAQGQIKSEINPNTTINHLAYTGCATGLEEPPPYNSSFEEELFSLVNSARTAHGLTPYIRLGKLDRAAHYHTIDMAADAYFQHDTYDRENGNLVKMCDWDVRVKNFYVDAWSKAAENIAAGATTPQQAMELWMNSTPHRENILSTTFNEIGVGYYFDNQAPYQHYWTLDFVKGITLPVELSCFTITVEGKTILLIWMTESESNNLGFEIQYKSNTNFIPLAFVPGYGTTTMRNNYEYRIHDFPSGHHTFRLRQIDSDGNYVLSQEQTVWLPPNGNVLLSNAYPNPFNPFSRFYVYTEQSLPIKIELFDIKGRLVEILFSGNSAAGQASWYTIDATNLPGGTYFYRLTAENDCLIRPVICLK